MIMTRSVKNSEKKSEFQMGFEPMTFHTLFGCSTTELLGTLMDDIPEGVKSEAKRNRSGNRYSKSRNSHSQGKGKKKGDTGDNGDTCSEAGNTTLGDIDSTISDQDKLAFQSWHKHDDVEVDFCQLDGIGLQKPNWGTNLEEFTKKFSTDTTEGQGPAWLKNLYFTYTLMLRAITKAAQYWSFEQFYTGVYHEDEQTHKLVHELLAKSRYD
ncbi:hypothetical protein QZH41_019126 [Actinostola sp. cb2023]|nr:hypothetical protein QZH41_019126 [Actinostola sp. cb2023]